MTGGSSQEDSSQTIQVTAADGSSDRDRMCPSVTGSVGAQLIAISIGQRSLGYVTPPVLVDDEFVAAAGEAPEKRFRFAATCVKSGCSNWTEGSCQVIRRALSADSPVDDAAAGPLPVCGIRATCQWFAQAGGEACRVCPGVRNPGVGAYRSNSGESMGGDTHVD
jgi:hypothetical protein